MKKYCLQCGEEYYDKQQRVCQKDGALLALPDPYELIGQTIGGKYRIDALIGLGGWGAVYSAHQLGLERRVALKILQPNLATQSEGFIRDFEHEARVVARLAHENIVIVFDSGRTAKDIPYLAMEWLEGCLLEDALIEQGQLGFEQTAIILRQIVAALAVAHAERIVHRDLNPRNVMLVKQSGGGEQVKVLDFGIAKVLHTGAGYVTRVIGTPEYASPEQMKEGALIDERADIYSLGVMLYRMLTGEVPIKRKKEEHYIAQLLAVQPTPLHRLRPDVPMEIEKLVMEMLAKDMQPRPQNVAEVLRRFEAALPKRHSDIVTGADQWRSLGKIMINLKPQPDAIAEEHRERQHQPTMHKDFLRDEEGRPKRSPKITEPINRRPHASNTRSANRIGASNSIDRSPTVAWGNWTANTNWPELIKDLAGLALLVFGMGILFTLFSYDPADSTPNTTGTNVQVHNWMGPVGANLASHLYAAFGWLAWGLPIVLLCAGWLLLRPPELHVTALKLLGWLLVLFSVAGLLALSDLDRPQNGYFHRGGWIGQLLVRDGLVDSLNAILRTFF